MSMQVYYQLKNLKMPIFGVCGSDFRKLGFTGVKIGELLRLSEKKWAQMGFPKKKSLVIDSVLIYNKRSRFLFGEKHDGKTFK